LTRHECDLEKGADTSFLGFHCQVAKSSPSSSILFTSYFWDNLLSPARGAWEFFYPHLIGLAMPIGWERFVTVVLALDIIYVYLKDE
jgi:hypothetical protein